MPVLHEPIISLERVKIRSVSLSSIDLDIMIRVQNQNPLGITLREIPFVVLIMDGERLQEIANGNAVNIRIPARDHTVITIPVTSHNTALIRAIAAFISRGGLEVTIKGVAVVDCLVTGWSVPFEKTVTVTAAGVVDSVAGRRS